jgi:hypothetical protein
MAVRVDDDERNGAAGVARGPPRDRAIDNGSGVGAQRAGVDEQRAGRAEDQIEEWLLEVGATDWRRM